MKHGGHSTWFLLAIGVAAAAAPLAAGCDDAPPPPIVDPGPENPLATDADFVAIPRDGAAAASARAAYAARAGSRALPPTDGREFYLAIRRRALAERYFLSAFLDHYVPGEVPAGAGTSMGLRVVTFREQNDKLFVFDASEGNGFGPVFDPEVLVEAYPIVHRYAPFDQLPGANDFVLVDPSAGLNRFNAISDNWTHPDIHSPVRFEVELSFLQRFRSLADGVAYQQVFTGYLEMPDPDALDDPTVLNTFQGSGTLSIAIRRYQEGPGFVAQPATLGPYFFNSRERHNHETGELESFHDRWNVHPGMAPIRWKISRELPRYVAAHPELAGIDVVGAVERGMESWNQAFGFEVIRAELAGPNDAYGDDDKNFIIFDPTPATRSAYADWRPNPVTGELRGAVIYFGANWLNPHRFVDDPPAEGGARPVPPPAPAPAGSGLRLTWEGVHDGRLCDLVDGGGQLRSGPDDGSLTREQKVERFIEHLLAHEMGHNLGLRHNFKGSMLPPTSSVMEYTLPDASVSVHQPGSYDVAAIRLLYGLAGEAPDQPFCTDEDVGVDPECRQYDAGARPLYDFHVPRLAEVYDLFFSFEEFDRDFHDLVSEGVLGYVRAAPLELMQIDAYEAAMAPVRAPLPPEMLAERPGYGEIADAIAQHTIAKLFGQERSRYARITKVPTDSYLLQRVVGDLQEILVNSDGVRGFASRKLSVDVLKQVQRLDAYRALLTARAQLAAQLASGTLSDEGELYYVTDLLARIDEAISPYFD